MKPLDRMLQRWRISKVGPYIEPGNRVLDIGCADGALFRRYGGRITRGIGIDPGLDRSVEGGRWRLIAGRFPEDLPQCNGVDLITMLAVLEHIPPAEQPLAARHCARLLSDGGRLVITVPSPAVESVLRFLKGLRLIEGMSLEQHYGFDPRTTEALFSAHGLQLTEDRRFQLGLNNLYVFRKRNPE